jgi:hypothetical protein
MPRRLRAADDAADDPALSITDRLHAIVGPSVDRNRERSR